nr:hypothetical protein [Tanacetum cinerariifolium]
MMKDKVIIGAAISASKGGTDVGARIMMTFVGPSLPKRLWVGRGVKEKESNGTKRNTTSGIGLSSEFDDTMNVDTLVGVAFAVKEGVTSSVVDKTVEMEKISSLEDTAIPKSFSPLSTMVTTTTSNAPGKSSYANITGKPSGNKVSVRTLFTPGVNGIDVVVPMDSIHAISERFANTAYEFFLGKKVAYPVVANYVRNTWGKYGLVRSMFSSSTRLFSFQFNSIDGLDAMLKNAFNKDGLSAITTKLGNPLMLDSYTSDMCMQSWGRSSYARVMIELRADVELKDNIVVAMPKIIREGHYTFDNDVKFGTNEGTTNLVNNVATSSKLRLLDNDGKPLVPTGIVESDSEVEVVFDETANLMISTSGKDGTDKGQPKKKKAKKAVFTFYIKYDGIFTSWPLKYAQGEMKEVNDSNFDEMSYEHLLEIVKRHVVEGRCVGEKDNKDKLMPINVRTGVSKGKHGNKTVEKNAVRTQLLTKKVTKSWEGSSQSPKWTKK